MLYSCKTSETITVRATPGTKIYSPDNIEAPKGEVPQSGKLKIKLPMKGYYGYLIAQNPQSNLMVPFGLDYKHTHQTSNTVISALGPLGGSIAITAGALLVNDAPTESVGAIAAGGALMAAGIIASKSIVFSGIPSDYEFSYMKNQTAIQDLQLATTVSVKDPVKNVPTAPIAKPIRKKASSIVVNESQAPTQTKAKRTLADAANLVSGAYTGSGKLLQGKSEIERYDDIRVVITKAAKNQVHVQVVESGEDFFETPMEYTAEKQKDGSFILSLKEIPTVRIAISSTGKLTFLHDKVGIDGDTYTLSINAQRE